MSKEPPRSVPGRSSEGVAPDRLDSWKDIATYLKRDVSTVQRWEKREAMPVHRHRHAKLGSVYAFRSELDTWWAGRGVDLTHDGPGLSSVTARREDDEPSLQGTTETRFQVTPAAARSPISLRLLASIGAAVLVCVATIALVRNVGRDDDGTSRDIRAIAVLPLDSGSTDPGQEYLAAGITDALISELGKIGSLRVIARSSVVKYKGQHPGAADVGRELDVQAVVSGSVVLTGNRIRLTVAVIDAIANRQIWSNTAERAVQDVLRLQREVAASIAERVRARLPHSGQAQLATLPPVDPAAFDAVLRARYLSVGTTDADNQYAITLLERAIRLDPGFAAAHAELAKAQVLRLAYVTPEASRELEQKAFASAEKALSLDPDLPEAYLARGDLQWSHSQRFAHDRAVKEFRRALALNPNSDQAHQRLARVYVHVGFFEEALQHAAIALAINPSNAQALNSRAQATLWAGKDEDALALLLGIPGPVLPELVDANTAFAFHRLGRLRDAWRSLDKAAAESPNDPSGNLPAMQALLFAESAPAKAERLLKVVEDRKPVNPAHHAAYFAAAACARMGRAEAAVRWLREAADTGFPCSPLFAADPNLDPIRKHPEFVSFMTDMEKRSASLRQALFAETR